MCSFRRDRTQSGAGYKFRKWLAAKVIHPYGIEWTIKTFDSYKISGSDGIFPILLKKRLSALLGSLTRILRTSIALRHVPQAWSGMTKVVFLKPGRNDHILTKNFRPVSLMSFILKTLERLIEVPEEWPLVLKAVGFILMSYKKGRSTDTVLHHLVSEVELGAKNYAVSLTDIEGVFEHSNKSIKKTMTKREIPEALVDWTQNMLTKEI